MTHATKSTPKITRVSADDSLKMVYRHLGNNHAYPFIWAGSFTVVSGVSEVVLCSGVKFHGYELASNATVVATPNWDAGDFYVTKDTSLNKITITCANNGANDGSSEFDVMFMLGVDPVISGIYCRGNTGASPSLP